MTMTKTIIGIDGGLNGAFCVMQDNNIIEKSLMPIQPAGNGRNEYDYLEIIRFLQKYPDAHVALEKAHPTPMLGTIQAFAFGKSYGAMIGILSALKIPYTIIHSKTWQTKMFRDMPKQDTKASSVQIAQRLFPNESFVPTARSKKSHDGLTDATLIAYYQLNYNT